jgi:hypothetical protein
VFGTQISALARTLTLSSMVVMATISGAADPPRAADTVKIIEFRNGQQKVIRKGSSAVSKPASSKVSDGKPGQPQSGSSQTLPKVIGPLPKRAITSSPSIRSQQPVSAGNKSGEKRRVASRPAPPRTPTKSAELSTAAGRRVKIIEYRGALPTPSETERLQRTLRELENSIRELERNVAAKQPGRLDPQQSARPIRQPSIPRPYQPNLQRVRITADAHLPGDSGMRLARSENGRLRRFQAPPDMRVALIEPQLVQTAATEDPDSTSAPFVPQPLPDARPTVADSSTTRRKAPQRLFDGNAQRLVAQQDPPSEKQAVEDVAPLAEMERQKSILEISTNIGANEGELPPNFAGERFAKEGEIAHGVGASRSWAESTFLWEPAALCHQPLFFEEVNAERHGYSAGALQPAVSAAHFFTRVPALPYLMTARPHNECVYTLGHYRSGSYAPYHHYWPPFNGKAGLLEAGVVTGLIFLIP